MLAPGLLTDRVRRRPHFLGILQLLRDLACGMVHIHDHDVIHGDLNPRNILIKLQAEALPLGCVAKVADFGLALNLPPGASSIKGG